MTKPARERIALGGSVLLAIVVANILGDVFHLPTFADLRSAVFGVAVAAFLGATCGAALGHLRDGGSGLAKRTAATGALSAALSSFLVLRMPSPWIDLGPFGAGPLTALALVVLPVAQCAAIAAARRWSSP